MALEVSLASPKSRIFALAAPGHKNVRRLHIPVNNAFAVRGIQAVGNLYAQIQHLLGR